jgi:hypothetical protein
VSPHARFYVAVLPALAWAIALSVVFRMSGSYPKYDGIAIYTGSRMILEGAAAKVYEFRREQVKLEIGRTAGTPGWAPRDVTVTKVLPGEEFGKAAQRFGYPNAVPPVFVYQPSVAVLCAPFAVLPWRVASFLIDFSGLFFFAWALVAAAQMAAGGGEVIARRVRAALVALVVATVVFPLRFSLLCGQITPLVVAALLWAVVARGGRKLAIAQGVAAGCAAAVKGFPLAFGLYFLWARRWVELVAMVCTFCVFLAGTFVFFDPAVSGQWMKMLAAMGEGVRLWTHDQSVDAFVHRFVYSVNFTTDWAAVSPTPLRVTAALAKCVLVAWCIWNAVRHRANEDAAVPVGCALLAIAVLLPPISWIHYGLFLVPGLVVMLLGRDGKWVYISKAAALLAVMLLMIDPDKLISVYPVLAHFVGEGTGSVMYRLLVGVPTIIASIVTMLLPGRLGTVSSPAGSRLRFPWIRFDQRG